ncbi:MAG: hypothetical protein JW850_22165, partial [Thermoflexales bacterium]|nr:hypothetical protein [Thermoflexales bacterium]
FESSSAQGAAALASVGVDLIGHFPSSLFAPIFLTASSRPCHVFQHALPLKTARNTAFGADQAGGNSATPDNQMEALNGLARYSRVL